MNDKQREEIAQSYVNLHSSPLCDWTASFTSGNPLLTIYYQLLDDSETDIDDFGLRTIEISARDHRNDHPEIFYFDNELEPLD